MNKKKAQAKITAMLSTGEKKQQVLPSYRGKALKIGVSHTSSHRMSFTD